MPLPPVCLVIIAVVARGSPTAAGAAGSDAELAERDDARGVFDAKCVADMSAGDAFGACPVTQRNRFLDQYLTPLRFEGIVGACLSSLSVVMLMQLGGIPRAQGRAGTALWGLYTFAVVLQWAHTLCGLLMVVCAYARMRVEFGACARAWGSSSLATIDAFALASYPFMPPFMFRMLFMRVTWANLIEALKVLCGSKRVMPRWKGLLGRATRQPRARALDARSSRLPPAHAARVRAVAAAVARGAFASRSRSSSPSRGARARRPRARRRRAPRRARVRDLHELASPSRSGAGALTRAMTVAVNPRSRCSKTLGGPSARTRTIGDLRLRLPLGRSARRVLAPRRPRQLVLPHARRRRARAARVAARRLRRVGGRRRVRGRRRGERPRARGDVRVHLPLLPLARVCGPRSGRARAARGARYVAALRRRVERLGAS